MTRAGKLYRVFLILLFWAGASGASQAARTVTGSELVLVEGGSFLRGSEAGARDEKPARELTVDSFYMGALPVTQAEYERIMRSNPSRWTGRDNPVDSVRWVDAITFCNELSRLEGLTPVYNTETFEANFKADGYRLPTEAEWEYAARAGTASRFFWGEDENMLGQYAWFRANASGRPRPAGRKLPNPLGLFDMYGNVWEWCHDYYSVDYYERAPSDNPRGPSSGDQRVLRGGSWDTPADSIASYARYSEDPGYYDVCFGYDVYGFRIVRTKR